MIKSIIVAVDDTQASRTAQDLAIRIAAEHGASLSGIGVVDRPRITTPTAAPIGGSAFKQHRDEVLLEKEHAAVAARLAAFHKICGSAGVACREMDVEGVPHEQIEREAYRHDLIVIGRDTDFHEHEHPDIAETVTRLLRDNPRPVLVVPPHAVSGVEIVVAFDGSLPSSRAAHLALLLGLTRGKVHVVNVSHTESDAMAQAERLCGLFDAHGVSALPHAIAATAHPADVLIGAIDGLDAGMLVMGAFSGHGLVHRIFVGSATRRLLEACPVPLFVYH